MNRPGWLVVSLSVFFFALGSCETVPSTPDGSIDAFTADGSDSGIPGIEVAFGTGQTDWEDVPVAAAQLELIYGSQGGYHVWGRGRFRGFEPDVDVGFIATDLTTGRLLHMLTWARRRIENNVSYGLESMGNGVFATDAELVILNIQCSDEAVGHQLQVRVFIRERSSQRIATDVRTATVVDLVNPTACAMH